MELRRLCLLSDLDVLRYLAVELIRVQDCAVGILSGFFPIRVVSVLLYV